MDLGALLDGRRGHHLLFQDRMTADQSVHGDSALGDLTAPRGTLELRLAEVEQETPTIARFTFVAPNGADLPPFTAGAHIEVLLGEGMKRAYSLCSDPADRKRYAVAVLREAAGKGGSRAMHLLAPDAAVTVTVPRNHFALAGREARHHLLLAGGIGVTPMMAMIRELDRRNAPWTMHYCTRDEAHTAFRSELAPHVASGRVIVHHDGGDPSRGLDISALLATPEIGAHVYFCGPPGFMAACQASVGAWAPHTVHREYFTAPIGNAVGEDAPFRIKLRSSGRILDVPPGQSIVAVLRSAGCSIDTDCTEGYCGTCITRYLSGTVSHRDTVLSEAERRTYLMVCCSRAEGGVVELDI